MAARTRTLLQMRTRVRKLADTGPDTATGRHKDSDINTMINESWQAMRELVSYQDPMYLKPVSSTMTAGVTAPFSFGTIPLPDDCVRVYGIDVAVSTTDRRSLESLQWAERNEWQSVYGLTVGIPTGFFIYNIGTESTTSVTVGTCAIFPAPKAAYAYTIWYLPNWIDISDDTFVFNGVAGWDDWVAWDATLKICAADNDMQMVAQLATQEREKAETRIIKASGSVQRAGPVKRIDIAAINQRNRYDSKWGRP